ncbi:hypothetical protein EVG20_g7875 [Dentipellis fragilis]|uniref:Uncharacterized protein n=1 Tax=Dentipellis fragilis TaxID=205917 RepID=A0A4Y9YBV1_9AGAM|nr:hypothetical protein EVG20_g7875 [Dentipellis fragilis]
MFSSILSTLGLSSKTATIGFWGPDVSEITTLVHALKTGEYKPTTQPSLHPFSETFTADKVSITAAVPSANEAMRRQFASHLATHDGIVYLINTTTSSSDADLAQAKTELSTLLSDPEFAATPILVLASSDVKEALGVQGALAERGDKVAFFTYSLAQEKLEGYPEGQYFNARISSPPSHTAPVLPSKVSSGS